jgi:hypothetical protein
MEPKKIIGAVLVAAAIGGYVAGVPGLIGGRRRRNKPKPFQRRPRSPRWKPASRLPPTMA